MRPLTIAYGASLFALEPEHHWRLPKRMREISGLALTPDGRLMGHDDEVGVIYEIDIHTGEEKKRFSLGEQVVLGDFEGLAIREDGEFYLTTSQGLVYRFHEGVDREHVHYQVFDSGMSAVGEVEGLAYHPSEERVIFACKTNFTPALRGAVAFFGWSPNTPDQPAEPWLTIPVAVLADAVGAQSFHPSSIEVDGRTGRLVVLAGREHAMVELEPEGLLTAARGLNHHHRQAEGATILSDGALIIADEGGHEHARMTRYARIEA
jgi:hypothetical protein